MNTLARSLWNINILRTQDLTSGMVFFFPSYCTFNTSLVFHQHFILTMSLPNEQSKILLYCRMLISQAIDVLFLKVIFFV